MKPLLITVAIALCALPIAVAAGRLSSSSSTRIVGGTKAKPYPYFVYLIFESPSDIIGTCGATLVHSDIGKSFVLLRALAGMPKWLISPILSIKNLDGNKGARWPDIYARIPGTAALQIKLLYSYHAACLLPLSHDSCSLFPARDYSDYRYR